MNFDLTDEQKMLVDTARRYVREKCGLEARRGASQGPDGFSREHWANFTDMGWLALTVPEDVGGLGGSSMDVALLMEQLGESLVAEPLVDTAILGVALIARSDNAALRTALLQDIAAGQCITALAHVEGEGRFEYDTPVTTRAVRSGSGWMLNGVKQRVFHGNSADCLLVTANLADDGGFGAFGIPDFSVFAIPRSTAGITIDSYELIDGTRAADITLQDVTLDADAILLQPGAAWPALEEALDRAILAATAAALGSMEAVMAMTAEYIKTRVQYGKPLSTFQALQHRMAEMFIEADQVRSILYRALAATEAGDACQRRRAVSAAKTLATRAGHFIAGQGIQLHGGIGVTEEYAVGRHFKAMLAFDKRFGDASFHLTRTRQEKLPVPGRAHS